MESNNYEWFIADTVEAMLPKFSDRNLALVMCIDFSWTDFGYAEDGNTKVRDTRNFKKKIWLVFRRVNNSTLVLANESQKLDSYKLDEESIPFKQYSDHDDCWRSDGFRWMFKTFVEAWDYFDQFGVEGRKIDPMVHWSIFGGKPTYWLADIKPIDSKARWTTDYIVTFNEKLSLKQAAELMPEEK